MLEQQQTSAEELEDNQNVEEGDMLTLFQEDRNAVQTVWSDAIMPYTISDALADRKDNILAAFKMISDVSCIRFVPHTTEFNVLNIEDGKGCASFVGCQGGDQPLYYSSKCRVGNLCHELIHALGLHHEHTREDRDEHITVQWENIVPGKESNFKVQQGNTQNLPYDINSIMHYGPYFFSQDGSQTVVPKQSGADMGQRTHLSDLDIKRLNKLYHCGKFFTPLLKVEAGSKNEELDN
ncbi:zinc metalloproteinase nas-4-like [Pseudoliparis swirei]|uniref:zinc metalloproteinase nas-4-like n=1 Tax=Pseudoliparis swirei TaxID=2059687 RepID=UPI0024BD7259|nr:zinc metalloproteinase nas-4-like [Pseudoliparis swirei]